MTIPPPMPLKDQLYRCFQCGAKGNAYDLYDELCPAFDLSKHHKEKHMERMHVLQRLPIKK